MRYWTDLYRVAGEEYGTSDKLAVNLLRDGWVCDSLEDVERAWWPHIRAEQWFYFEQVPRWEELECIRRFGREVIPALRTADREAVAV